MLVGAGIGVTPFASILKHYSILRQTPNVLKRGKGLYHILEVFFCLISAFSVLFLDE
jgi:predicted ferric reductase